MNESRRVSVGWLAVAALLLAHFGALVLLLRARGLPMPQWSDAAASSVGFFIQLLGGLLVYGLIRWWRGERAAWLAAVRRPVWWAESLLMVAGAALLTLGYTTLKVAVPLLHGRRFDALLWEIDRWTLLGMSPNILAVELIQWPAFFRAIDVSYAAVFQTTMTIAFAWALAREARTTRVSWLLGSAVLWLGGAWLYLALPSLGPAYVYLDVWSGVREWLPRTTFVQKDLIENYLKIVGLTPPEPGRGVNLFYGVAAFPSLHVGFQAFVACWLQRFYPRLRLLGWAVVALVFVGSIVTGWHYMIDSIAGLALGWGASRIAFAAVPPEGKSWRRDGDMMEPNGPGSPSGGRAGEETQ